MKCDYCNKVYTNDEDLSTHILAIHTPELIHNKIQRKQVLYKVAVDLTNIVYKDNSRMSTREDVLSTFKYFYGELFKNE